MPNPVTHLSIGTTGDYRPFSYLDPVSNELIGFDIQLIKLICDRMGTAYSFLTTTWNSFETELEIGKFDIAIGGISLTRARKDGFLTSTPLMEDGKIPIVHVDNKHKFMTMDDIDKSDVTVIVNPGGTNEVFARQQFKHAKIVVFADNNLIFEQIVLKTADVMITDRIEALYHERINNMLYAVNPDHLLTHEKYGFLFAKNNHWLRNLVDEQLRVLQDSTIYKSLVTRYLTV